MYWLLSFWLYSCHIKISCITRDSVLGYLSNNFLNNRIWSLLLIRENVEKRDMHKRRFASARMEGRYGLYTSLRINLMSLIKMLCTLTNINWLCTVTKKSEVYMHIELHLVTTKVCHCKINHFNSYNEKPSHTKEFVLHVKIDHRAMCVCLLYKYIVSV